MPKQTTITEALAEVVVTKKRIQNKSTAILPYVGRSRAIRDPLGNDGASAAFIASERQAIGDLNYKIVRIRSAIASSNQVSQVTYGKRTTSVFDALTWRREVAPVEKAHLQSLINMVNGARKEATKNNLKVVAMTAAVQQGDAKPDDIVIEVDEKALHASMEELDAALGELDGKLSLLNATTVITIPD